MTPQGHGSLPVTWETSMEFLAPTLVFGGVNQWMENVCACLLAHSFSANFKNKAKWE